MSTTKTLELTVGLFAVLGLAAFFMLAMQVSNIRDLGDHQGYVVNAHFDNIGGLKVRAPVTLAGVRIGRVVGINIDKQTYEAVVSLSVDSNYRLPTDSSASILTSGLLGEQYIGLEPGGMDDYLQAGDRIKLTQSALVLEKLVGRLFTSMASDSK
ncbi:MAG: outer membrane lipid asymmetry maintenance protein MlaD [Candidatus Competibacteraceae bacterium]|jgi:phospholipid/cholesterol/gamma-HCH transport system substrate-binding protein|nr:outer membrane lipid asymmetry maintenance protein MlaD [Candidatus Competibacteraceae bacterium]